MHSQPPKSPLSGGLWKLREGRSYCRCILISLIHHLLAEVAGDEDQIQDFDHAIIIYIGGFLAFR